MRIEIERNAGEGHSVDAILTILVGDKIGAARVRHYGLSPCGEAFFSDVIFDDIPVWMQDEVAESVRDAAHDEIKAWWSYNGSEWSEPVDDPEDELVDEPDGDHQWAVVKTDFHGGGIEGYAVSEESAADHVKRLTAGTGCVCGCFGICDVAKLREM